MMSRPQISGLGMTEDQPSDGHFLSLPRDAKDKLSPALAAAPIRAPAEEQPCVASDPRGKCDQPCVGVLSGGRADHHFRVYAYCAKGIWIRRAAIVVLQSSDCIPHDALEHCAPSVELP